MIRDMTDDELEIFHIAQEGTNRNRLTERQRDLIDAIAVRTERPVQPSFTVDYREQRTLYNIGLRLQQQIINKRMRTRTDGSSTHEICQAVKAANGL